MDGWVDELRTLVSYNNRNNIVYHLKIKYFNGSEIDISNIYK